MKLLMVTPYLPYPPASGGQIRTFNLLKYLSQSNEITLVCLYKYEREKQYVPYLEPYCKKIFLCKRAEKPWKLSTILTALLSTKPFLVVRNYSKDANTILKRLLKKEQFDVIHVETFYVMPHIPQTDIPTLLVEQTIEFKVYEHFVRSLPWLLRFPLYVDILKLKYWEKYYWEKASIVATVSQSDKVIVEAAGLSQKPIVIPNGAGDEMIVEALKKHKKTHPTLLFQGNFSWLQNTEAANYLVETLHPSLKKILPEAEVIIAGQYTGKIPKKEGVTVINVDSSDSETVKKLYQTSTLFVAPIFGPGGTRLKILAAMASGLPIVSTPTGVQGLDLEDGKHVLIAKNKEEFITKIREVLKNAKSYEKIRGNAYQLIMSKYNWRLIASQLEKAYKKIIISTKKTHENSN